MHDELQGADRADTNSYMIEDVARKYAVEHDIIPFCVTDGIYPLDFHDMAEYMLENLNGCFIEKDMVVVDSLPIHDVKEFICRYSRQNPGSQPILSIDGEDSLYIDGCAMF